MPPHTLLFALQTTMSTGATRIVPYAIIGAAMGLYLFYRGFRMLQYKRLILNTPLSKVRSASMGLVEVIGVATGPQTIPAGLTGAPCYYYRAVAWEYRQSGRNRQWKKVADESLCVPFFVQDATGQVLVNPQGGDLDSVHRSFRDEFGGSYVGNADMLPENISKFLLRNGLTLSNKIRLEEHCIQPSYPLFILGTLSENPDRGHWPTLPHAALPSSSINFAMNASFITGFLSPTKFVPPTSATAIPLQTQAAAPAPSKWSSISMDEVHKPGSLAARHAVSASAKSAPIAETTPSRVGTAIADDPTPNPQDATQFGEANPAERDADCSAVICKGTGDNPFTISCDSQRDVVRSLGWKSAAYIWGGPLLTLASLYALFQVFGW